MTTPNQIITSKNIGGITEKLAFALIILARRLQPYFQAHSIQVVTGHPLRNIFEGVELMRWQVYRS
ncbi:hypothetical protein KSP40_PGU001478 [Platanthera guangdongensis]|uniref:Uncharacterized protein n=1 Tax=Platanthera guangdongensis TaxID=2320717 RepID=A0ABR2M7C3_9ASPA